MVTRAGTFELYLKLSKNLFIWMTIHELVSKY